MPNFSTAFSRIAPPVVVCFPCFARSCGYSALASTGLTPRPWRRSSRGCFDRVLELIKAALPVATAGHGTCEISRDPVAVAEFLVKLKRGV